MNIIATTEEVMQLAERLGMEELKNIRAGAVNFLTVPIVHKLLDRIEALEKIIADEQQAWLQKQSVALLMQVQELLARRTESAQKAQVEAMKLQKAAMEAPPAKEA